MPFRGSRGHGRLGWHCVSQMHLVIIKMVIVIGLAANAQYLVNFSTVVLTTNNWVFLDTQNWASWPLKFLFRPQKVSSWHSYFHLYGAQCPCSENSEGKTLQHWQHPFKLVPLFLWTINYQVMSPNITLTFTLMELLSDIVHAKKFHVCAIATCHCSFLEKFAALIRPWVYTVQFLDSFYES